MAKRARLLIAKKWDFAFQVRGTSFFRRESHFFAMRGTGAEGYCGREQER
jgi:hypothetical protein